MTTLIIIGDSWGCGEWHHLEDNHIAISHPGLNEYLAENFRLINLSRGGASNWQILYTLFNYWQHNISLLNGDYHVVLIQTDAARNQLAERFDISYQDTIEKCTSLRDLYTSLVEMFYIKCDLIAQKIGINIHLCGGLSDLDLEIISLYDNLTPVCASWCKLMDDQHDIDIVPLRMTPELFVMAKTHGRLDICEEIIEHSDNKFLRLQHMLESEYFGPAMGDFHPSRYGHKRLSDFLKISLGNLS